MLYFVAEDHYYYSEKEIEKLSSEYNKKEIILFPTVEDIKNNIHKGDEVAFMSPVPPSVLDDRFKNNSFFETITLKNYYYPFTKEQVDLGIDQDKILSEKIGLKITQPTLTFEDYGGSGIVLADEARKIELRFLFDLKPKGFFLVGLPGTGKSFFAKCFAGETKRKLVEFNISKIKEAPNPMERIEMILGYFKNTPGKYLLWIDEIEKQFVDDSTTDILGVFLTELNEFQSGVSNVFFIATANNIDRISNKYPELLRPGGRFDKLIFLLPSTEDETSSIFDIYIKEKKKHFEREFLITAFLKSFFPDDIIIANNTRIEEISLYIEENTNREVFLNIKRRLEPFLEVYRGKEFRDIKIVNAEDKDEIKQISDFYKRDVISQEDVYRKIVQKTQKIMSESKKSYAVKSLIDKVIQKYGFNFPVNEAKALVNQKYREESVEKSRFPYTPSEISNIINVIYTDYYLSAQGKKMTIEKIIVEAIKTNIPIQKQFKQGITAMSTQAENFLRI